MPVAQVIRFDERLPISRPRRTPENQPMGVVLMFPSPNSLPALAGVPGDEDRLAGRGRDPG